MKPISCVDEDQMPASPITCGLAGGEEVGGETRTMTKSRVPFVGEASIECR